MGRPGPRLLRPALPLLLLSLLLAPPAEAERVAEDPDPAGDVTSGPGVDADEATVDLVTFTADREGDALLLRNEVAGALPLPDTAQANETRLYTFLFAVDFRSTRDQPLVQSAEVVVVCTFHHGVADLECRQSQGERSILAVGTSDRNVTVRIALDPDEAILPVVGGGAATLTNETTGDILAQDWTPTTIGGQDPDGPGPPPVDGDGPEPTPWTRRPATAVAVGLAVVGLSLLAYLRFRKRGRP